MRVRPSVFSKALQCLKSLPTPVPRSRCLPWHCSIAMESTALRVFISPPRSSISKRTLERRSLPCWVPHPCPPISGTGWEPHSPPILWVPHPFPSVGKGWATAVPHPSLVVPYRVALLCASRTGYQNLCRLVTRTKLRAPKNPAPISKRAKPTDDLILQSQAVASFDDLAQFAKGLICITGGDEGPLAHALLTQWDI